ncbi:hypothetical protein EPO44_11930 [bacterium]|nr:MAG: hypothetical protein EPO44_11930 [bacterium]
MAGDKAGAIATLREALQTANAINIASIKQSALERIAIAQANAGDFKGALQTANSIGNIHQKTTALRAIASAQAGSGDVKGALAWALNESLPFVKSYALLGVAEGVLGLKPRELISSLS